MVLDAPVILDLQSKHVKALYSWIFIARVVTVPGEKYCKLWRDSENSDHTLHRYEDECKATVAKLSLSHPSFGAPGHFSKKL